MLARTLALTLASLLFAACSGVGSSQVRRENSWVSARWERPREAAGGSELSWLEVRRLDGGELEITLLAFEDSNLDTRPDREQPLLTSTFRLTGSDYRLVVEDQLATGAPPIRWMLLLQSAGRDARYDLGVGPYGTTQKRY